MNKMIISIFILALTGCNTGQYQRYQSGIGYEAEQQGENVYYVTYTGSRTAKIEKANDFALIRSAELTLEKGFNYFVVIKAENNQDARDNLSNMSARALTGNSQVKMPVAGTGASARMTPIGETGLAEPKAKSELTIKLFNEKPLGISYDARQIERALKEEYEIDKEK